MKHPAVLAVPALLLSALLPASSRAGDPAMTAAARELGSALAWRLGPGAVENACRDVDPDGADVRLKALQAWLDKNAALIRKVDERVAEVVPLIKPKSGGGDEVEAVKAQVMKILLEPLLSGSPEERLAYCKEVTDPANARWTNNGMPHVVEALAALYDWKIQRESK